jgi:transposase
MNQEPQLWCGIDIAKNTFDAAIVTNQRIKDFPAIPVRKFEHSSNGVATFSRWLRHHCEKHELVLNQSHLVLEATGRYSLEFHDEVRRQCGAIKISIVNPAHAASFQKSLGKRDKTDALDARA